MPIYQCITIDNKVYKVNMKRLIALTSLVESHYGRMNYKGRIAKTPFQYEPTTADFYIKTPLKNEVENLLNKKLEVYNDKHSAYICYIIYMRKLELHYNWIEKYKNIFYKTGDVEYFIYKLYWNSIKGKANFTLWTKRKDYYFSNYYLELEGDDNAIR